MFIFRVDILMLRVEVIIEKAVVGRIILIMKTILVIIAMEVAMIIIKSIVGVK